MTDPRQPFEQIEAKALGHRVPEPRASEHQRDGSDFAAQHSQQIGSPTFPAGQVATPRIFRDCRYERAGRRVVFEHVGCAVSAMAQDQCERGAPIVRLGCKHRMQTAKQDAADQCGGKLIQTIVQSLVIAVGKIVAMRCGRVIVATYVDASSA